MKLGIPFKDRLSLKPLGKWTIILAAAALATSTYAVYQVYQQTQAKQKVPPAIVTTPVTNSVTALGQLEPQGEVIKLSAPSGGEGARISQLLVKQGQQVEAGQVIAILDSHDRLQAELETAKKQVQVAQANLNKVKAGAKGGEITAQKAEIARLQAQLNGEIATQRATIARLVAQLNGERKTQQATIARFVAQLDGERRTQKAAIARNQAELNNATSEFERYQNLYNQGAVQASTFDNKRLGLETAREQLNQAKASLSQSEATLQQQINEARSTFSQTEATVQQQINEAQATRNQTVNTLQQQINVAKATLEQIAEVRPTDVQASQAEVESAIASVKKAQTELDLVYVRSPIAGQIININTRPGETVSNDGIVELGQTGQMYAVAEVYETEISQVRIGQPATIKSSAFAGKIHGTVDQLGLKIGKKNILNDDPAADQDARVVEVKIRLDPKESQRVSGLTNLQVEVAIDIDAPLLK